MYFESQNDMPVRRSKRLCLTLTNFNRKTYEQPLISGERCLGDFIGLTAVNKEDCVRIQINAEWATVLL